MYLYNKKYISVHCVQNIYLTTWWRSPWHLASNFVEVEQTGEIVGKPAPDWRQQTNSSRNIFYNLTRESGWFPILDVNRQILVVIFFMTWHGSRGLPYTLRQQTKSSRNCFLSHNTGVGGFPILYASRQILVIIFFITWHGSRGFPKSQQTNSCCNIY